MKLCNFTIFFLFNNTRFASILTDQLNTKTKCYRIHISIEKSGKTFSAKGASTGIRLSSKDIDGLITFESDYFCKYFFR